MNDYRKLARDYEYLVPRREVLKQRPFFRKLIHQYDIRSCLDCACGTGCHLSMLNDLGIKCAGSDLELAMLARAKKNLRNKKIPLRICDFQNLSGSWKEKFDLIICMHTSFPHMLTQKDATSALRSIYARLNEGGVLVISNGISDAFLDARPKIVPARIGEERAFYFFLEYPNSRRVDVHVLQARKTKRAFAHDYYVFHYHAMRKSVLQACFSKTRFRRVNYFGDHKFTPYYVKKSQRLIAIAQK